MYARVVTSQVWVDNIVEVIGIPEKDRREPGNFVCVLARPVMMIYDELNLPHV